jgi:hypothetical protein
MPKPAVPSVLAPPQASAPFTSLIVVADFPALFAEGKKKKFGRGKPSGPFAEFRGKRFTLLWRGSRDGFSAPYFHGRCDGHANTLTLIEDTEGNIFGGFTPVKWDSSNQWKADPSLKSFVFTLKNPHRFPARKFALKAKEKDFAIICDSSEGPSFCEIRVHDNCNADTCNCPYNFGRCYTKRGQPP